MTNTNTTPAHLTITIAAPGPHAPGKASVEYNLHRAAREFGYPMYLMFDLRWFAYKDAEALVESIRGPSRTPDQLREHSTKVHSHEEAMKACGF